MVLWSELVGWDEEGRNWEGLLIVVCCGCGRFVGLDWVEVEGEVELIVVDGWWKKGLGREVVIGVVDGIGVGGWGVLCKSEKVGLEINDVVVLGWVLVCVGCCGGCYCCVVDYDEVLGRVGRGGRVGGGVDGIGYMVLKVGSFGSLKEMDVGCFRVGWDVCCWWLFVIEGVGKGRFGKGSVKFVSFGYLW